MKTLLPIATGTETSEWRRLEAGQKETLSLTGPPSGMAAIEYRAGQGKVLYAGTLSAAANPEHRFRQIEGPVVYRVRRLGDGKAGVLCSGGSGWWDGSDVAHLGEALTTLQSRVEAAIHYVTPEMFGAPTTGDGNDTEYVQNAVDAAIASGQPLVLNRMYDVDPITAINGTSTFKNSLSIIGNGTAAFKRNVDSHRGLRARGNQAHVLQLGGDRWTRAQPFYTLVGFNASGITFDGGGFTLPNGVLLSQKCSQAKLDRCNFRRARGPVVLARFMEDWNFNDCNFGLCGNNDGVPAFAFDNHFDDDREPGNNAIIIHGARFEFVDGPLIGTVPNATNPWVSTLLISDTKFEAGSVTLDPGQGDPGEIYGAHSRNYYLWDFRDGPYLRKVICAQHLHLSAVTRSKGLFALGNCGQFLVSDVQISTSGARHEIELYHIAARDGGTVEARGIDIRRLNIRQFSLTGTYPGFKWVNRSTRPVHFEIPEEIHSVGLARLHNTRVAGVHYASEIASGTGIAALRMDPDPGSDPCLSPFGTVAGSAPGRDEVMIQLSGNDFSSIPGRVGFSDGLDGVVKLSVRCKQAGASPEARIDLAHGQAGERERTALVFGHDRWHWINCFFRPSQGRNWHLRGSRSNVGDTTVYIDAVRFQWVREVDAAIRNEAVTVPARGVATQVISAAGPWLEPGAPVHATPATPVRGVIVNASCHSAKTLDLILQNVTDAEVMIPAGQWKLRIGVTD